MAYDAVVFDLDGTLVEPTDRSVLKTAAETTFEQCGVRDPDREHVEAIHAGVTPETVEAVAAEYGVDPATLWRRREDNASLAQRVQARLGHKRPYDDVDVLRDLDRPTGIVTTNQQSTADHLLERFELGPFGTVHGREPTIESLERKKPNTHYLDLAVADLAAERALYVGDSESDVIGAHNAGMDSALVERDHVGAIEADPTHRIGGLAELAALL